MPELTVVTFNLRGIHDRWWKREPLVIAGLAALRPDVVCLQEAATWCLQARWVAWRLSRRTGQRYDVRQARKRGWRGVLEGVATLSRHPLNAAAALPLGGSGRVALRTEVRGLTLANAHLEHRSFASELRRQQLARIVRWLQPGDAPKVICGDLNDIPDSPALGALTETFRSAHGPDLAIPGTSPAWNPHRVIDYVMVVEGVEVLEAGTCLDTPVHGTWPSDHVGLWAKLRF